MPNLLHFTCVSLARISQTFKQQRTIYSLFGTLPCLLFYMIKNIQQFGESPSGELSHFEHWLNSLQLLHVHVYKKKNQNKTKVLLRTSSSAVEPCVNTKSFNFQTDYMQMEGELTRLGWTLRVPVAHWLNCVQYNSSWIIFLQQWSNKDEEIQLACTCGTWVFKFKNTCLQVSLWLQF